MSEEEPIAWSETQLAWVEVGRILATQPDAEVRCPQRDGANLVVFDILYPNGRYERYMVCPVCGIKNVISGRIEAIIQPSRATYNYSSDLDIDQIIEDIVYREHDN